MQSVASLFFARSLSFLFIRNGGDEEDRTPDPLLARQVLSQLSYTPTVCRATGTPPRLFEDLFRPSKLNNIKICLVPCTDQSQSFIFQLLMSP